ncbi:Hypothetical protein BGHDH14_bgh02247 [Blumeria hordei DH14]|uniref:Trafficking protein particle complex II-specific subunit 65 IgD3 domain-containing protein n=1 Tax=Blumeria graminis f. sp. hordei (strain DH14) TaxID=546991 RepID=N1JI71_BLUG1|nr:Hypothetical protein BGHDH14_bgh02247 [Blumeria hordei DH14]
MAKGAENSTDGLRGSAALVESSSLNIIVPLESTLEIESTLRSHEECFDKENVFILTSVPQRQALFFDETLDIYVLLQTPYFDEKTLRSYLTKLAISVQGQISNAPGNANIPPGQDIIYSGSVQESEDPFIVVQLPDVIEEETVQGNVFIVWKISASLSRPRFRLHSPSVTFTAKASLRSGEHPAATMLEDKYLPSQVPSAINILEAFGNDPSISGIKPRLSALRISQTAPISGAGIDSSRVFRNGSHHPIKIYPAINPKIKHFRPNTASARSGLIACIDIDITPFTDCQVILRQIKLDLRGGQVEDLNAKFGISLPVTSHPLDNFTLMYYLDPDELDTKSPVRDLVISIFATVDLSNACQPKVSMHWTTLISFAPPVNPGFGAPTSSIKRSHKPAQLSIDSTSADRNVKSTIFAPDRSDLQKDPSNTGNQRKSSIADFGITLTIYSPPSTSPIYLGAPFSWTVLIVNRSEKPRRLALIVNPKDRLLDAISQQNIIGKYNDLELRVANNHSRNVDYKLSNDIIDEKITFSAKNKYVDAPAKIICLNTDLKIGVLLPMACHEVEIRFMALNYGILSVDAIRLLDLDTHEYVDIRDLPIIIVSPQMNS